MRRIFLDKVHRSALDHIELTYHDVTVFAIPEFKGELTRIFLSLIRLSLYKVNIAAIKEWAKGDEKPYFKGTFHGLCWF